MKIEDLKGCFANVNDDNLLRKNGLLYAENKELKQEIERLNNIIKILDNYVIGDRMFEFGDTREEAEQYLQELKGDGSNEL